MWNDVCLFWSLIEKYLLNFQIYFQMLFLKPNWNILLKKPFEETKIKLWIERYTRIPKQYNDYYRQNANLLDTEIQFDNMKNKLKKSILKYN